MSGFMFSKPCPLCKARNSLEVDYNLGEVVCLQCVKVVANGLMEDEQERFDKDGLTNMDAGEKFAGHDGKPTLSSASDITTAASSGPSRVPLNPSLQRLLKSIQERSGSDPSVCHMAQNLYNAYCRQKMAENRAIDKKSLLIASCFVIESVIARFPVLATEIMAYEKCGTGRDFDAKIEEVLQIDRLRKEKYEQALASLPALMAQVFFPRLSWSLAAHAAPITQVFNALTEATRAHVPSPRPEELFAIAMLLAKQKGRIHDAVFPSSAAIQASNDDQVLAEIAAAVRMSPVEFKSKKEKIVTSLVLTAAGEILKGTITAAEVAAAPAKRARE